jgi:hypothetical protein
MAVWLLVQPTDKQHRWPVQVALDLLNVLLRLFLRSHANLYGDEVFK